MRTSLMTAIVAALFVPGCGGSVKSADAGTCDMVCGDVQIALQVAAFSCTFVTRCPRDGNVSGLAVFVSGQQVAMDPTLTEGWYFTDGSMRAFVLYGQACADALAGDAGTASVTNVWLCEVP